MSNQKQRLDKILIQLHKNGSLTLGEIMKLTNVSRDTARRDIIKLTSNNLAIRNYGGISVSNSYNQLEVFLSRLDDNQKEKEELSKAASQLVKSNSFLYLDVSTTVSYLPMYLKDFKKLYTFTNSLDIADRLLRLTKNKVRFLGGVLDREKRCTSGTKAVCELKDYRFDIAFISATGLTESGVYYSFEEDIEMKKMIRKQSNKLVLLLDQKKINVTHYFHVFNLCDIDILITSGKLPANLNTLLKENGVKVILIEEKIND